MMNESAPAVMPIENLLGKRIVAGIIDFVVLIVVYVVFAVLFGDNSAEGGGFSSSLNGLPALLYFLAFVGYFVVLEGMKGQTLGKMAVGIKVVAETGEMSYGKAAIRTLLRIIDGLFLYIVGIIVIAISKKHQRIGDMAAGTLVVRV
jgi:uncharacterized RDD family membrane protein YckC